MRCRGPSARPTLISFGFYLRGIACPQTAVIVPNVGAVHDRRLGGQLACSLPSNLRSPPACSCCSAHLPCRCSPRLVRMAIGMVCAIYIPPSPRSAASMAPTRAAHPHRHAPPLASRASPHYLALASSSPGAPPPNRLALRTCLALQAVQLFISSPCR